MAKAGSTEKVVREIRRTPAGGSRPKKRFGSCWRGSAGKRASRRSAALLHGATRQGWSEGSDDAMTS